MASISTHTKFKSFTPFSGVFARLFLNVSEEDHALSQPVQRFFGRSQFWFIRFGFLCRLNSSGAGCRRDRDYRWSIVDRDEPRQFVKYRAAQARTDRKKFKRQKRRKKIPASQRQKCNGAVGCLRGNAAATTRMPKSHKYWQALSPARLTCFHRIIRTLKCHSYHLNVHLLKMWRTRLQPKLDILIRSI